MIGLRNREVTSKRMNDCLNMPELRAVKKYFRFFLDGKSCGAGHILLVVVLFHNSLLRIICHFTR